MQQTSGITQIMLHVASRIESRQLSVHSNAALTCPAWHSTAQHSTAQQDLHTSPLHPTYLLQSFLHLLKMGFFVEMRGHDLGNQGLQHIGKEEEQEAAQQSCKGAKHVLHMSILVVFGVEAADEKGDEESHTQKAPQGLLQHSTQNLACFESSSTTA